MKQHPFHVPLSIGGALTDALQLGEANEATMVEYGGWGGIWEERPRGRDDAFEWSSTPQYRTMSANGHGVRAIDERTGHWADHLQCNGGRNWNWGCLLKRPRLRCLVRPGPQANLDWRPHYPWQDLQTQQSLPARSTVQAAWVVLIKPKAWERYGLKRWIEAAKKRLHRNVLAIALANKLARIAWSVLAQGGAFETSKLQAA